MADGERGVAFVVDLEVGEVLHDGVIQDLVSLNYQFAQLEGVEVDWIGVEIRKIILSIRRVCRRLRPPTLEHLGLVAAIRSLLREFREECGESMEVIFRAEEGDFESLSEDIGICVYRVLCEALANVRKHSHADRVHVELGIGNGEVNLVVKDNGEGFTVPHHLGQFIMEGHYGLAGVRERVEQVHGSFEIGSNQDGGTRIACRIPIEDTNVGSETQLRT